MYSQEIARAATSPYKRSRDNTENNKDGSALYSCLLMNEVLGYQHEDNKDLGPGGAPRKILPNRKLFHVRNDLKVRISMSQLLNCFFLYSLMQPKGRPSLMKQCHPTHSLQSAKNQRNFYDLQRSLHAVYLEFRLK